MGRLMANAQPKNGIQSNSRLMSVVCGLRSVWTKSVSHVLWCLTRRMQGSSGMCSRPSTVARMPQVMRSQPRTMRVQVPMTNENRALAGSIQPTATDRLPQVIVEKTYPA